MNSDIDTKSPCVKICKIDPIQSFCIGCGRTLEEIRRWIQMSKSERLDTNTKASNRLETLKKDIT